MISVDKIVPLANIQEKENVLNF